MGSPNIHPPTLRGLHRWYSSSILKNIVPLYKNWDIAFRSIIEYSFWAAKKTISHVRFINLKTGMVYVKLKKEKS